MVLRTDAVVLRAFRYGETSLIVTLFSREKGKISVLAKGARVPKSRFGATLQPLSMIEAVYSYKPTRTLQTLRETSHVLRFRHLHDDLNRLTAGLRMVELVQALMQDEETQRDVFHLLVESLQALDGTAGRPELALFYFELRLAMQMGYAPQFTRGSVETLTDAGGVLSFADGRIDGQAGAVGRRADRLTLRAFAVVARAELHHVLRMQLDDDTAAHLGRLIEDYLRFHAEDAYPSRAQAIRARLLHDVAATSDGTA